MAQQPETDELIVKLSKPQPIGAPYNNKEGKPDPDDLRTHVKEHQHCFVDFEAEPGKGITQLNSRLSPGNFNWSNDEKVLEFTGDTIRLNGYYCKVHAKINLETMKGEGFLEPVADP
eukprot:TRINITY_DN66473_c8_g4_i2.p1 TRINITY_DN66473_c8_g4~~TRINITY_DN66473_c8_g4_i2.p1  ORF type:complete len:117 (+),score=24.13 TRINITY_DN66473_c8_g4_i2:98-448(+)